MRIIHVFRGAIGGLFRHVCDQVEGQAAAGHDVGIFCDSLSGGSSAAAKLAILAPLCKLGITRVAMKTLPGPSDLTVIHQTIVMAREARADILHGHGAKGGLYARLAAKRLGIASAYVPHGGSLHYEWKSPKGAVFLAAEKMLRVKRSGLIFVCEFERGAYAKKIGLGDYPSTVIYNGLGQKDFAPRKLQVEATDYFYVGEMRSIKGVDILLQALATISPQHRPSLTLVGDGPEEIEFKALASSLALDDKVTFAGRKSMHEAMRLGRTLVVPSR
ncbi:MAG: glycosyltransferase family 4 protein, partial [Aestuariivirga sp.]